MVDAPRRQEQIHSRVEAIRTQLEGLDEDLGIMIMSIEDAKVLSGYLIALTPSTGLARGLVEALIWLNTERFQWVGVAR